jgi:hypothetical protein
MTTFGSLHRADLTATDLQAWKAGVGVGAVAAEFAAALELLAGEYRARENPHNAASSSAGCRTMVRHI